jgi:pyruvate/2-oxoglutarate/acetoin dehydrogenase E1 component
LQADGATLVDALGDALRGEMERDADVIVMGEDVGRLGGVFRVTDGLQERFGPERCVDTPLAEAGMVGAAVGLTMAGWRPVCELQFDAFSYPALDQVICHVSRYRWRSGGGLSVPLVLRMPYGGGVGAPELHQESPETYYVHTPGLKVVVPSTPADAKGLLTAAIRDPDPVVVLEPKALYRSVRGPVPAADHELPIGCAERRRTGDDLTLVAYGAMVRVALAAADELALEGVEAEVLDLRSLKPLDENAILDAAARSGRVAVVHEAPRTLGVGAEVAALLAEKAIFELRAPVLRVTGLDVPYPYWSLEDAYLPSAERVVAAARELMRY